MLQNLKQSREQHFIPNQLDNTYRHAHILCNHRQNFRMPEFTHLGMILSSVHLENVFSHLFPQYTTTLSTFGTLLEFTFRGNLPVTLILKEEINILERSSKSVPHLKFKKVWKTQKTGISNLFTCFKQYLAPNKCFPKKFYHRGKKWCAQKIGLYVWKSMTVVISEIPKIIFIKSNTRGIKYTFDVEVML